METPICVNCLNKKPVNQTDNRLVTESCGHVKCMNCLLREKSGCLACQRNGNVQEKDFKLNEDIEMPENTYETSSTGHEENKNGMAEKEDLNKKKKPETSHIQIEMDGDVRCYMCTVCKKKFHARSQVAYHAYCNGQRKPYQCPECNKSFATHSHFKYHMRVHRNERTYACDVCGDSFFQMSKLQRHKLKHTKEKKYPCTLCNKAFNNVTSLRKHALTHTEERPFACATCGRRFRDASNYKKHVVKHGNTEKGCGCDGCGRCGACKGAGGGADGGGVRSARPHVCPRCPQAFHSRKDMRRHAAVHSGSKPFRCKVCDRRFRRKDNLERHIRNTHPDYLIASAVECDEAALKDIVNGPELNTDISDENYDKTKLEILNPLPPLPQEVMQKHFNADVKEKEDSGTDDRVLDKLSIIEANNARESVIVEKRTDEKKAPSAQEYVHKIRKAVIPLPPIDQEKLGIVQRGFLPGNADLTPPSKTVEVFKKILCDKIEKDTSEVIQNPKMHWLKKMEQDIN